MSAITPQRLAEMVSDALERTCFMISDPAEPQTVAQQGFDLHHAARIAYTGPNTGTIHLFASDGFLEELASGLLGCEPDEIDIERDGRDAIRELANILGGSVTLELGGDRAEHRLGLPEDADPAAPPARIGADCNLISASGALRVAWTPETLARAA